MGGPNAHRTPDQGQQTIYMLREAVNGPFAANGHMVQKAPCWRASFALGHPKQRIFKFDWMNSLCLGRPSA